MYEGKINATSRINQLKRKKKKGGKKKEEENGNESAPL